MARLAVSALILLACFAATMEARMIIVGNASDPVNSWNIGIDYVQWMKDNPLYVGDIAVFKYPAYYHVVWDVIDQASYDNCNYDLAQFIGNDTAGQGEGFLVEVTDQPRYLACGVFNHCEASQKVILNGTLGPLPAKLAPPPPPAGSAAPPPTVLQIASPPPPADKASPPPPGASVASPTPTTAPAPKGASSLVATFGVLVASTAFALFLV